MSSDWISSDCVDAWMHMSGDAHAWGQPHGSMHAACMG